MNKTAPWNIKGVGFDAREAAHLAARKAGVPLGEWLNGVICERAQELGVSTDEFSADDRLDALVARLAGVAESVLPDEKSDEARAATSVTGSYRVAGAKPMSHPMVEDELPEVGQGTQRLRRTANGAEVAEDGWASRPRASGAARAAQRSPQTWDNEILLDQAMELVGRRTSAAEERASGERQRQKIAALAREVELLNRAEPDDDTDGRTYRPKAAGKRHEAPRQFRDVVGSVAERIGEIEHRISSRDFDHANRPIVAALSRLEDRFEHLLRRNADGVKESARVEATFRDLDARLRDIAVRLDRGQNSTTPRTGPDRDRSDRGVSAVLSRLDAAPPADHSFDEVPQAEPKPGRRPARDPIVEITQRQADLDESERRRASLMSGTSHASMEQFRQETAASESPSRMPPAARVRPDTSADTFSGLNDAFARLTERLEARIDAAARARTEAETYPKEDIGALKSGIAALGDRLDAMRVQSDRSRASHAERDDVESLRNEIAALQVGLAKLAPQTAITTLESAVRELGGQIDDSRRDGISEAVLGPLERLRAEVHRAVEARDVRGTLERIEEQLGSLTTRLAGAENDGSAHASIDDLRAETREMRDLVLNTANQFEAVERLELEISHLGSRLERLTEQPPRSAIRDLELAMNEIRTMLVEISPNNALQDLSRKLDHVMERFGAIEEQVAAPAAMFDEFSRRMDQAHAALADRLAKAAPAVDLAPIQAMIGGLSGKIDGLRHSSADMQALGGLVRGLAAQIEEARLPSADAKILDTLETQVGRLAERLDRSDASLDAISSVELLVRDLFQQLEETRSAAIDAAEIAARNAAQETLRATLVSPVVAGDEGSAHATRVVEQIGQELSEFRKAQQASEKRVHSTLLALNETLERMVDRMVVDTTASSAPAVTPGPKPAVSAKPVVEKPEQRPVVESTPLAAAPVANDAPMTEPTLAEAAKPKELKLPAGKPAAPAVEIGRPTSAELMPDVSPLIAAARRAAQAAQTSANDVSRKFDGKDTGPKVRTAPKAEKNWHTAFRQNRRPVLLSIASVVLLLGALQIARLSLNTTQNKTAVEATATPAHDQIADATSQPDDTVKSTNAAPVATPSPAPSSAAPRATTSLLSGSPANPSNEKAAPATTTFAQADPAPKALAQGLRELADRGDPAAEAEVGARLAEGRGVTRDAKASASWFERAAKQGFAPAEYRLGSAYEKGNGVTADPAQAIAWYEKAADQGNVRAMHNLAVMAAEGSTSKPDYARAARWFTKAAEHGVRDSQYNLAILYARGLGLSQDLPQSYTWFSIAAAQGDADAAKKRDDVAAKLDADKIAAAKGVAAAFKPLPVDRAANDISAPPGGWDVAGPVSGAAPTPKVSSM